MYPKRPPAVAMRPTTLPAMAGPQCSITAFRVAFMLKL